MLSKCTILMLIRIDKNRYKYTKSDSKVVFSAFCAQQATDKNYTWLDFIIAKTFSFKVRKILLLFFLSKWYKKRRWRNKINDIGDNEARLFHESNKYGISYIYYYLYTHPSKKDSPKEMVSILNLLILIKCKLYRTV